MRELATRLAYITIDNDYSSDAGLHIYAGQIPKLGPDDPPEVLAISVGDETQQADDAGRISYTVPVEVIAILNPTDIDSPLWTIEAAIRDIKVAVEIEGNDQNLPIGPASIMRSLDGTLPTGLSRGVVRTYPREGGSEIVGASVEYQLSFQEEWGQPDEGDATT